MSDSQVTFEEWWIDFARGTREADYYEASERLLTYVAGLSGSKRDALVKGLVDVGWLRHGSDVALGALERLAGPDARRRVARAVETLPTVRPPHPLGDFRHSLLRVLAADPSGECLAAVDSYCQDEIGPGFTTIVWALWPHHGARFAQYHARYFAEQPWDAWGQTAVVQAFLTEPPALEAVRDALLDRYPDKWANVRNAVIAACTPTPRWCSEENAREVRKICGLAA